MKIKEIKINISTLLLEKTFDLEDAIKDKRSKYLSYKDIKAY